MENVAPVHEYFTDPSPDDDARTINFKVRNLARFLTTLGVSFEDGGYNPSDAAGATAKVLITVGKNEQTGDDVNEIRWPRLPRKKK